MKLWTTLLALLSVALTVPPTPKTVGFFVHYGPASRSYTNKLWAAYPQVSGSNFSYQVNGLPTNKTWFSVTVTNKSGESDYSNETSTNKPSVTLLWNWSPPPSLPVTNIVTVAAGTNSLTLTNPPTQFWRLKGRSWTNADLQASGAVLGPYVAIRTWNYASNKVPKLTIQNKTTP